MNFLIVVAAVLMVRHDEWIHQVQRDQWFTRWLARLGQSATPGWLPLVLMVALPAIGLGLLLYVLADYRWITFVINAVVLLYAIGRGNWHDECHSWVVFFAERDPLVLKQKIAGPQESAADVTDVRVENTWLEARQSVLYHQLEGFYTVVFWFFFVGAPVALCYRLLHLYRQHHAQSAINQEASSDAGFLLWMMEWIPVRIMGMLFCMVGNFTTGFWVLRQVLLDGVLASAGILARCADAALFLDGSVDDDAILDDVEEEKKTRIAKMIERMESRALEQKTLLIMRRNSIELQALLQRAEWAFLVVLALIALI